MIEERNGLSLTLRIRIDSCSMSGFEPEALARDFQLNVSVGTVK